MDKITIDDKRVMLDKFVILNDESEATIHDVRIADWVFPIRIKISVADKDAPPIKWRAGINQDKINELHFQFNGNKLSLGGGCEPQELSGITVNGEKLGFAIFSSRVTHINLIHLLVLQGGKYNA